MLIASFYIAKYVFDTNSGQLKMGDRRSPTTTEAVAMAHGKTVRDTITVRTHGQMGAGT